MAYIYKITNDINGKVYIGKTLYTIEKRWREHLSDSKKDRCEKRPLYDAINKYGEEHFHIELIEECTAEMSSIAEEYWINKYRSYIGFDDCNGYNATLGGDSKHYADYNWIIELWNEGYNNRQIQDITKYDAHTIMVALDNYGINSVSRRQRGMDSISKKILMYDKQTDELLYSFESAHQAARHLSIKGGHAHIIQAANGKRKTAYGYKWKYE